MAAIALATVAGCSGSDGLVPLIASGDAVRVLASGNVACPSAFGDAAFDDSGWQKVVLPMASVPRGGVCLRASFDVGTDVSRYRWLTITLSGRTRALLNAGKPLGDDIQAGGGIDWSTDDGDLPASYQPQQQSRFYTLDLRLFPSLLQTHHNVLALQIPETPTPVDISAVLQRDDVTADDVVQVTKGPYRLRPSPTSMRIAWESDRSAPSWLVVDGRQYDGGWAMHHEVEVDGLVPGRSYEFYVATAQSSALPPQCQDLLSSPMAHSKVVAPTPDLDDDQFWKYLQRRDACNRLAAAIHSTPSQLHVAAAAAPTVRVAIVGDTRATATGLAPAVIDAVTAEAPDLVVHTGDVVATGADMEWQTFFDASAKLLANVPLAPVPGERDLMPWGDRFGQLFGSDSTTGRAYSIDLGAVHLAFLDSTKLLDAQAAWLDADLTAAEAKGARHEIVILHWGPWTAGASGASALASVVPVAARHGVEAIVSGHENIYEHGVAGGMNYFITGGANASPGRVAQKPTTVTSRALPHYLILEVNGDTATMSAKDLGGVVFDQVTL